jgi:hypothetical protein
MWRFPVVAAYIPGALQRAVADAVAEQNRVHEVVEGDKERSWYVPAGDSYEEE